MTLLNVGFGNLVSSERILTILSPDSSPIKRIVHIGKENGTLIDATCGRKTQSVIIMDSGHIVTSSLSAEALSNKINKNLETH